jgi:hypothetical protein
MFRIKMDDLERDVERVLREKTEELIAEDLGARSASIVSVDKSNPDRWRLTVQASVEPHQLVGWTAIDQNSGAEYEVVEVIAATEDTNNDEQIVYADAAGARLVTSWKDFAARFKVVGAPSH